MRIDKALGFYKTENVPHVYQEFPNADNITRRLKKLIQILGREEYLTIKDFGTEENQKESTGLTKEEKERIIEIMLDRGIPITSDSKDDIGYLKDEL